MPRLRHAQELDQFGQSRAGRMLQTIRRSMDMTKVLMDVRRRNEEVLSLAYQDPAHIGGDYNWANIRENSLNIPYRWDRWTQAQATSKKMVVKVNRDAGAGQKQGGPGDDQTGMWLGILLERLAYEGGFQNEMPAVIGEVNPRGTSVMAIGYHKTVIDLNEAQEVGKDAQSVMPEVLTEGDLEAKDGQAHTEISAGLQAMAEDPEVQEGLGSQGIGALIARKDSHDDKALEDELDDSPITDTRLIRHKIWMRKMRVGEDVGWAPWIWDVQDSDLWWDRHENTVAEIKGHLRHLFTDEFLKVVEGFDGRNMTGVHADGRMPNDESMSSEAREAMKDGVLEDDEKVVEWFTVWFRRPNMISGGVRKIVCYELPDKFIQRDESNPWVDDDGFGVIPGFYPFWDFTPIKSSLKVPESTLGIPPMAVAMPQFEKLAEYNRIRQEAALKGATSIIQIDAGLADAKDVMDAINKGKVKYAFISPAAMVDDKGHMRKAMETYSFSGTSPEIEKQSDQEKMDCLNMLGMPPAIFQGMGTAKTLGQDQQGISAGENEASTVVSYYEKRMADVMGGFRGLIRSQLDDEDFVRLLGEEGGAIIKAWVKGTVDDGDEITVTFGATAQAQETVNRKQLMEAITILKGEVDPALGLPLYDSEPLIEELMRTLDVGAPKKNDGVMRELQEKALKYDMLVEAIQEQRDEQAKGKSKSSGTSKPSGGPNPSEGSGPTQGNLQAGAVRGTVPPIPQGVNAA